MQTLFQLWQNPVFLATDILLYILVFTVFSFAFYARTQPHLRRPWGYVIRTKMGVSTITILAVYILIGLLDSVHFHPQKKSATGEVIVSTKVVSIFEEMVAPLKQHQEKTYSAPLATVLFSKETIDHPDGRQSRDYPPLKYGGQHLKADDSRTVDLIKLSLIGLLKASGTFILVLSLFSLKRTEKTFKSRIKGLFDVHNEIPTRTFFMTLFMVLSVLFVSAEIAVKYHLLGTDKVGEDVLYQALKSIRTGLVIGTLTTLMMLPIAVLLGIMAGYFKGWVDDLIQYIYTTLNAIPFVLLIAASILMMQVYINNHESQFSGVVERADLRLLFLCLILGLTSWTGLCRLLRGETFKLRELEYVQAATAFGVGHFQIIARHIFPNILHILLIALVLDFSGLVLAEAVLSYINIGVDPTTASWGNMINSARLEMAREPIVWWSLSAAFIFMFGLVLAANLLSDVVRDAFDPRLSR